MNFDINSLFDNLLEYQPRQSEAVVRAWAEEVTGMIRIEVGLQRAAQALASAMPVTSLRSYPRLIPAIANAVSAGEVELATVVAYLKMPTAIDSPAPGMLGQNLTDLRACVTTDVLKRAAVVGAVCRPVSTSLQRQGQPDMRDRLVGSIEAQISARITSDRLREERALRALPVAEETIRLMASAILVGEVEERDIELVLAQPQQEYQPAVGE